MKNLILLFFSALAWGCCETPKHEISLRSSEYVTTLVGTQSDYSLSTGNTYPAVALPWGMNFWTPQTGKMGDGWAYTYGSHTIRGLKQTHQPSPWINDYGQFSIMPVRGKDKVDENARQSWFSHQSDGAGAGGGTPRDFAITAGTAAAAKPAAAWGAFWTVAGTGWRTGKPRDRNCPHPLPRAVDPDEKPPGRWRNAFFRTASEQSMPSAKQRLFLLTTATHLPNTAYSAGTITVLPADGMLYPGEPHCSSAL